MIKVGCPIRCQQVRYGLLQGPVMSCHSAFHAACYAPTAGAAALVQKDLVTLLQ